MNTHKPSIQPEASGLTQAKVRLVALQVDTLRLKLKLQSMQEAEPAEYQDDQIAKAELCKVV